MALGIIGNKGPHQLMHIPPVRRLRHVEQLECVAMHSLCAMTHSCVCCGLSCMCVVQCVP